MPPQDNITSQVEQLLSGTLSATAITSDLLRQAVSVSAEAHRSLYSGRDSAADFIQRHLNGEYSTTSPHIGLDLAEPEEPVLYTAFGGQSRIIETLNLPAMERIPENSNTLAYQETTSRFNSAIWYDNILTKRVLLVGLGGIGSYVAYNIARLRPARLVLFDNDKVEAGNMSGQLFGIEDVGKYKVDVTKNKIERFCNYFNTNTHRIRFGENSAPLPITICGLDNMESRRFVYEKWKANLPTDNTKKQWLFIDGRLAAEELQVFCITGDDSYSQDKYEREWLFSDDEADATICSYKQTTYVANLIGAFITNLFINFCANECDPIIPRDLPFFTSYDASTMFFKTQV